MAKGPLAVRWLDWTLEQPHAGAVSVARVEIENTGTLGGATTSRRRRPGIGLENVRRRLALHYPGRHQFTLGDRGAGTDKVVATLVLEGDPCGS